MIALEASAISTVASAMASSFTTQVADITTGIGTIVPTLLPVVGVLAVIFIGLRLFRRVTGGR